MKTAEIVKIKIEKLDDDLCGVAFRGGKKYVVAKTLPDEEVLCEVKRKSGNAVITAENLGFGYEVLCGISPRVKRYYINQSSSPIPLNSM